MASHPVARVILWGFMASGKTMVGRSLAERLGWRHVDLDAEIVREQGRSIAEIFRSEGEPAFRALELEVTRRWITHPELVLSPGGGWVTNPACRELVSPDTLTVWLRVSPATVLARVAAEATGIERPLLRGDDPVGTIRSLLADREPLYRTAALHLDTDDRSRDEITDQILSAVRSFPHGLG